MHTVAIMGAGPLGGALARALAAGDAVSRIVLIDEAKTVAAGKALDIRQAGPLEAYDTVVEGSDEVERAAGADVVVVADRHAGGEWTVDAALPVVGRLARLAPHAPIVMAGASHHSLMTAAVGELKLPAARLVGTAPVAAVSAARALMAPWLDASPTDLALPVLGLPPGWVLAWDRLVSAGGPVDMPPHATTRVEQTLAASWPPGPYSLASAASGVVRAMLTWSRRRYCCFAATPFGGVRPVVFAVPVTLSPSGIAAIALPELSPRQRVALESSVLART
jgi:malate dehydrogenase